MEPVAAVLGVKAKRRHGGGDLPAWRKAPGWNSNPGPSSCEAVVLTNLVGVYIR